MKNKVKTILIIIITLLVIFCSIIFSFSKFSTFDSVSSFIGVMKILFTNTEYDIIQRKPNKVIIAKPITEEKTANDLLDEYMQKRGFEKTDRHGSLIIYSNGTDYEKIDFSINAYYSIWEWI